MWGNRWVATPGRVAVHRATVRTRGAGAAKAATDAWTSTGSVRWQRLGQSWRRGVSTTTKTPAQRIGILDAGRARFRVVSS